MQTRHEVHKRLQELIPDIQLAIHQEADRLIDSGAIDLEVFCDNFALPKAIMVYVHRYLARQYEPPAQNKELMKLQRRLAKF